MQKIRNFFLDSAQESRKTSTLVVAALFIALNVTVDALGFRIYITQQIHIGLGFLSSAMIGMLFGPVMGMTAGAATDILSYLVSSRGEAYFPGFTLTAVLAGLFYGIGLYGGKITVLRAFLTKAAVNLFLNICLNTLWMKLFYGKAFWALLPMRIGKNLLMLPFEVVLLYLVGKTVERIHARSAVLSS